MKYFAFINLLFFSLSVNAQKTDTIPEKQFENFFGSDCDSDTLILPSVRNSEIVFYKNESKLMRTKKGKVKWEIDLLPLSKEFPDETFCLIQRGVDGKPRQMFLFIDFVSEDKSNNFALRSLNGKLVTRNVSDKVRCNLRKPI